MAKHVMTFFVFLFGVLLSPLGWCAVDVSNVVSAINDAMGPVTLIGSAVLVLIVGIKVFKWIRRAL